MIREEAISDIAALFPINSEYPDTAAVGARLLIQAVQELNWRDLPDNILFRYASLCRQTENRQHNEFMRKHKDTF